MKNKYQRLVSITLCLTSLVAMLAGCSKAPATQTKETNSKNYITVSNTALPEEVTKVTRFIVHNDIAYICAQMGGGNTGESTSCIATMGLDKSDYKQLIDPLDASHELRDFAIDTTGNIWAVSTINSKTASLLQFSDSGTLLQSIDLAPIFGDGITMNLDTTLFLNLDASGNIYVTVRDAKTHVYVFDNQGQPLFNLEDSANPLCTITTAEGNVALCDTGGSTSGSLLTIDAKAKDWSKNKLELGTVFGIYGGSTSNFYIFDSSNFYGYNSETQSKEEIFNWSNLGLSTGDAHVCELSEGRFAALTGSFSQTGLYSYELTIVEPGVDARTTLTMSSIQPNESVLEAVAQFNKSNQEYRVDLTQYFSSYDDVSDEDLDGAIEKFNLDIISGNIPDIIDLSNMPIEIYYKKGILEDLYSCIETDKTINMDDYFENVLEAFSIDGGLPYVTNSVAIETFFADASVVGTDSKWKYSDVLSLLDQHKLGGLNSEFFLERAVQSNDSLINWSTGESYFDSAEFIQLLELAAKIQSDDSDSAFGGATNSDGFAAIFSTTLSVSEVAVFNTLYQGNLNVIGLPNPQGTTYHAVSASTKIGMSAEGENKAGAWEFVRSFLEEKQQDASYFFPIRKASFDKVTQAALNGNSMWSYQDDIKITQQDIDITESLLSAAQYSVSGNSMIAEIVLEEAAAYFAGSLTAEVVATNIQNRIQTYINEQS